MEKEADGQVAFYDDGVGADGNKAVQVIQGMTGAGLDVTLQDAYGFIINHYAPGDRIYLFGFSRGAYTARSLGGMLVRCGVPPTDTSNDATAREALKVYRQNMAVTTNQFPTRYQVRDVVIEVIGVWDTVGALGIPLKLFGDLNQLFFRFHDTALHPNVRFGYHAVAIDEKRESFPPTLWDPLEGIEQVWFPGVHSDVGGGYPESGLSDVTLAWILVKVKPHGIIFEEGTFDTNGNPVLKGDPLMTPMHDSYKPPFITLLGPAPRVIPVSAALHTSVKERLGNVALAYQPPNLPPEPRKYVD